MPGADPIVTSAGASSSSTAGRTDVLNSSGGATEETGAEAAAAARRGTATTTVPAARSAHDLRRPPVSQALDATTIQDPIPTTKPAPVTSARTKARPVPGEYGASPREARNRSNRLPGVAPVRASATQKPIASCSATTAASVRLRVPTSTPVATMPMSAASIVNAIRRAPVVAGPPAKAGPSAPPTGPAEPAP